jgi:acetyl-CoA carboxylase alpha subunit
MIGGIGYLNGQAVTVVGQQRGKDTKDNIYRNFGMAHPEGYRKALRLMKLLIHFDLVLLPLYPDMHLLYQ